MPYRTEIRRTVIKVTEYKNGMIWKTKEVARIWLEDLEYTTQQESEIAKQHGGDMLGSMSTSASYDECIRSVKY